jgi:hypothetical protein
MSATMAGGKAGDGPAMMAGGKAGGMSATIHDDYL